MITIVHGDGIRSIANSIASDLHDAFDDRLQVEVTSASSPSAKLSAVNWDDLLIVVFDSAAFPTSGNEYIEEYLKQRGDKALLLPVALDANHTRPPKAAESFKSLQFDDDAPGVDGRLAKRVGAMLGLRVQERDTSVFISYRASDGKKIAIQLEGHLRALGYPVWRDEAQELDGETKILPGNRVQCEIDKGLEGASIVLLLDTPAAPHSIWIKHEVDTANAQLLPVLPLCFKPVTENRQGPRFNSLLQLQRWVSLVLPSSGSDSPLMDNELNMIVSGMETFLCEIFRRKCHVPFVVERTFVSRDFSWMILDQRRLFAESIKQRSARIRTKVFSHCSIFEQVHAPSLRTFNDFVRTSGSANHSLYIYDGELIPEPQLIEMIEAVSANGAMIVLNYQELAVLIDSHFTAVTI